MLEMLLTSPQASEESGYQGDANTGFYGEVAAADLVTGDQLASAIGLTAGTAYNSDAGWLKFNYYGKTLYIAKKPFRYGISWNAIYLRGAVYGDDTNGLYIGASAVTQNRKVWLDGKQYRVRLLFGSATNPGTGTPGRELRELLDRVYADTDYWPGQTWGAYSADDLGFGATATANGFYNWMIETYNANTANRLVYKYSTAHSQIAYTTANNAEAWRPVLELIP